MNMPCTLSVSDRPRHAGGHVHLEAVATCSTFLHWVSTTPPAIVMRLARVSKIAVSPVRTWSFCVTTTEPLASSLRIDELPPGPGVADGIDPDFDPLARRAAGEASRRRPEIIIHHERFRGHGGVALHDLHIAGEGRFLFLVAHFERRRLDLNRLVAVLRRAMHRIWHARHGALRTWLRRRVSASANAAAAKLREKDCIMKIISCLTTCR